jgi:hypothetical protein
MKTSGSAPLSRALLDAASGTKRRFNWLRWMRGTRAELVEFGQPVM